MTGPSITTVVHLGRHPVSGRHFSIERVFDAVRHNDPSGVETRAVEVPRSGLSVVSIVANTLAARRVKGDVIHVTGDVHYVLPILPRSAVRVLTIHDLASLNRTRGWRRTLIRWFWYTWPLASADVVTTVSDETRRQLVAEFRGVAHKVIVVGNPLTAPFSDIGPDLPRRRVGARPPVVLAIGTGANKNLFRTAEATLQVGATLRVVGKLDGDAENRLRQIGVPFEAVHSLSDQQLFEEYLGADVLSFPSLHEGFGLPILEAQALGVPVVTTQAPPMSGVAAGGALLVDPYDVTAIADAIRSLVEESDARESLRHKGFANARRHAPIAVAERYADVYREQLRLRAPRRKGLGQ